MWVTSRELLIPRAQCDMWRMMTWPCDERHEAFKKNTGYYDTIQKLSWFALAAQRVHFSGEPTGTINSDLKELITPQDHWVMEQPQVNCLRLALACHYWRIARSSGKVLGMWCMDIGLFFRLVSVIIYAILVLTMFNCRKAFNSCRRWCQIFVMGLGQAIIP